MALHSMCQPGRPSPHGLGQKTAPSAGDARLPQGEIGDGLLGVFVAGDALAGAHLLKVQIEQLAVAARRAPRYFSMLK